VLGTAHLIVVDETHSVVGQASGPTRAEGFILVIPKLAPVRVIVIEAVCGRLTERMAETTGPSYVKKLRPVPTLLGVENVAWIGMAEPEPATDVWQWIAVVEDHATLLQAVGPKLAASEKSESPKFNPLIVMLVEPPVGAPLCRTTYVTAGESYENPAVRVAITAFKIVGVSAAGSSSASTTSRRSCVCT
jgi:hypothetical protein